MFLTFSWHFPHSRLLESSGGRSAPENVNRWPSSSGNDQRYSVGFCLGEKFASSHTVKMFSEHEWFKVNLPDYLFPKTCEEGTNIIDMHAVQEVCEVSINVSIYHSNEVWSCSFEKKFSVNESEVQSALLVNDRHDQLVIAYHLIIDNKRIWNEGLSFLQMSQAEVPENFQYFVYSDFSS